MENQKVYNVIMCERDEEILIETFANKEKAKEFGINKAKEYHSQAPERDFELCYFDWETKNEPQFCEPHSISLWWYSWNNCSLFILETSVQ